MAMQPANVLTVRAPGRVNLIGEHTDYNCGFVLPAAIDLELRLTFRRRNDNRIVLRSREQPDTVDLPAEDVKGWARYVEGVRQLVQPKRGFEGEITSRIPVGAGLSSSAALELAVAGALAATNHTKWRPVEIAKLCQQAEVEYAGNRCGIMDQLAVACGKSGHALLIDCRSLEIEPVKLPEELAIVICDSAKPRQLVQSAYNKRREQCEDAAQRLGVSSLREATLEQAAKLPRALARRARHVIAENQRVLDFVAALKAGNLSQLGILMAASHASLRDLFEVSSPELDLLVDLARETAGCVGARLTGAGFGGCTVNLVQAGRAAEFAKEVMLAYRRRTGLPGTAYVCRAVDGASIVR